MSDNTATVLCVVAILAFTLAVYLISGSPWAFALLLLLGALGREGE